MDRSFLSQPEVIAASRRFVCVRLTTYENAEEAEFLQSLLRTRSGEVENTVFTLLSPDGKRHLARASRSARQTFGDAGRMAETMNRVANEYAARPAAGEAPPALPQVANVRLAVNVAACDNQPLVILLGPDAAARQRLEEQLRPLAWSEAFLGRFVYATASAAKDLANVADVRGTAGLLVVQPDHFGTQGTVLKQAGPDASREALVQCLQEGLSLHQRRDRSFGNHVREGHQKGVFWETAIPVTDPMERNARERGRRQGPGPE
jgi:hypothetical protein